MSRNILTLLAFVLLFGYTTPLAFAQQRPYNPPAPDKLKDDVLEELRRVESVQRQEATTWAAQRKIPMSHSNSGAERIELVGIEAGRPLYLTSLNRAAALKTHTATLYPGQALGLSLTGHNLEIGIWDGGVPLSGHQEFGGRVSVRNNVDADNHATHVAGTLAAAGVRAEAQGMAYEAHLRAYDWNDDATEMINEAARGLLLSNHSYGVITGWYYGDLEGNGDDWYWLGDPTVSDEEDYTFGWYGVEAAQFDRATFTNPYYLPVVAAGNDRGDLGPSSGSYRALNRQGQWQTYQVSSAPHPRDGGPDGFDSIAGSSLAKNVLTIGSVKFGGQDEPLVSSFSSFGPTDDGRIKPDLVGYGERVYSSLATNATAYGYSSGTSMATPNVTGSLALLQEHYHNLTGQYMRAATLKGLALHTAQDAGNPGPDYQYGWGLLDAEAAARQITASLTNAVAISEARLAPGTSFNAAATVDKAGPIRVTISWTDRASSRLPVRGAASLDDPKPHLINDLDVRLINDATGETYYPYILDPTRPSAFAVPGDNTVDPMEQVYIPFVEAGSYSIVVSHKGSLISSEAQPFSLLVTGAQAAVRPVAISHLTAEQSVDRVLLSWSTQFERSRGTFAIQRAPVKHYPNGQTTLGTFAVVGTLMSEGRSEQVQDYTFADPRVPSGRHHYRIFFDDGTTSYLASEVEINVPAPEAFAVVSNYPNPFADRTSIVLDLPEQQDVTLDVYDMLGRRVRHVFRGTLLAGRHDLPVDASGWSPGIYFIHLTTPAATTTHRMVVVR